MSGNKGKLALLAIGGNSLIRDKQHQRVSDQFEVARETCGLLGDRGAHRATPVSSRAS